MNLPQRNATLLEVRASGDTVDWDSPDEQGAEKFKGRADAYYTEKRAVAVGPSTGATAGRDLVTRRSLIIDPNTPRIQFEEGDMIRFVYRGTERTGIVETVEERDMPGEPVPGSIRLTLQGT